MRDICFNGVMVPVIDKYPWVNNASHKNDMFQVCLRKAVRTQLRSFKLLSEYQVNKLSAAEMRSLAVLLDNIELDCTSSKQPDGSSEKHATALQTHPKASIPLRIDTVFVMFGKLVDT